MFQILLTPSAGKRLIGKATVASPSFTGALKHKKIVIIAGTTNGYVAEEFLSATGQSAGFNRSRFIRGITLPPAAKTTATGRLPV